MSVQVYIPTPFRRATSNRDRVSLEAPDVKGLDTTLKDGDEVSIIPALAGGQAALAGGQARRLAGGACRGE